MRSATVLMGMTVLMTVPVLSQDHAAVDPDHVTVVKETDIVENLGDTYFQGLTIEPKAALATRKAVQTHEIVK